MKRLVLMVAFVATIFTAQAWTGLLNKASYIIAKKYMTPQARAEYDRIWAYHKNMELKWTLDKDSKC